MNRTFVGKLHARKHPRRDHRSLSNLSGILRTVVRIRLLGSQALWAGVLAVVLPGLAAAQGSAVRPRITDRLDETRLIVLQGNTHALARPQFDQGAAPPNLPMDRMLLVLERSPEQESALQDMLEQQQDKSSPNYHKWLTPDQFGQQFGPADQDIQVVTSWLTSQGFQFVQVSKGRTVIEFSGTAAQVQSALHTSIHKYVVNGEEHWANANDPQIPVALAPVVSGFASLHNFPKKPLLVRSGQKATATVTPGGKPQINLTSTTNPHALVPADFNVIYNVASTMTGIGTTIGVIAHTNINVQDVRDFRSLFGLPVNDPQVVLNGPDPGNLLGNEEAEAVLDATWSGAVAPNATVDLVVSEDTNSTLGLDLSETYIIDNNLADVMTESFSACEAQSASSASFYSVLAEQAASQGITFLVASGDTGAAGCDDPTVVPASGIVSVNLLASTPFTVAVGGTQFNDTASPSTYWNSTNAPNGESAKSYIPENVWNESCTVAQCGSTNAGLWSSGGGQSILFTKPPWQSGVVGIPTANSRFLPDVSLNAADHDGYVLCIDGSCQGTSPSFDLLSGTSVSAQAFGGIMSLVVQQTLSRQGQANYVLYKLAATQAATVFHDTTSGNTNIPGETGFAATTGYDEATGLGSVNVSNLVNQWNSAITKGSTTTLSLNNGAAVNITHGQSVPVGITVAAKALATGTPTGDVSLVANSSTGQGVDRFTLTNGSVNTSTIFLPGGTYNVTAHYAGDGTFTGSDSTPPISVTVNPEASKTSLGIVIGYPPCTIATSIPYGSPYILSVAVTDSAGTGTVCSPSPTGGPPSGTVALTDTVNSVTSPLDAGTFKLNSLGYFEDQPIQLPAGVHNIKAVYSGDNSFSGSTSVTDVVTVTKATTTTTVAANPTSVPAGANVTLTATVGTQSNAIASQAQEPTGNVQFFLNGSALGGPVAVTGGVAPNGSAQATANLTQVLPNGLNSITAQYVGDNNYSASAVSSAVTVSVGIPGINLAPASNTTTINVSALGQPGTKAITVSAANGYTGSVSLTCAVSPTNLTDTPTCSFSVNPIALTGTTTSMQSTLTVNTTVASAIFKPTSRHHGPAPNGFVVSEVGAVLVCFFLLSIATQNRRGIVFLAMVLFAAIAVGTSCGSYNNNSGNPGTTSGPYTVTVTATPTGATPQSTIIAVNVP